MKFIKLTQGKEAIVDDEDYDWLNGFKWTYHIDNYAYRKDYSNPIRRGKNIVGKSVMMHVLIMGTPKEMDTDHKNRNGLDNRRENLRIVDRAQNNFNSGLHKNNTSGHRGVSWCERTKSWRVYIGGSKSRKELGYFSDKEKAIEIRLEAEKEFICLQ